MRQRLAVLAVLVAVLCGCFVAYGGLEPLPGRQIYPGSTELADEYDDYVGDLVVVSGTVVSTNPLVVAASDGHGGEVQFTVVGSPRRPTAGRVLSVFGRAQPDRRIQARRTFVVDDGGLLYAHGSSALAGCWVLVRLLRRWRFRRNLSVVRRSEPVDLRGVLWRDYDDERGGDDSA
jgi:hypothetical protein